MKLSVISNSAPAHQGKKGRVTCLTCKLTGCVGRCRFAVADVPQAPKAA